MIPIQRKIIDYNKYPNANKVEYIVLHDTGNPKPTADALNHYKYFSGGNRGSSAHYFVDKNNIIQIIGDKDGSWAVGDGKNKYGIHNRNSISVEMCINDMKAINTVALNAIDLAVHLLKKHNLGIDKLVRHYDASRKSCPNFMKANNWAMWIEFKTLVQAKLKGGYEDMAKDEVVKIVNEIIRPSSNSEKKKHWADESYENLKSKGIEIHEKRLDDVVTRGEMFAMMNRMLKL